MHGIMFWKSGSGWIKNDIASGAAQHVSLTMTS